MRNKQEARQPWYGAGMRAQPQPKELNGEPVRRPARRARVPPDGLYRYVPVPPAYYDADGYLVEDGMTQNIEHQRQTARWREALELRLPAAMVCSDLAIHYREGDRKASVVPDLFVAWTPPPVENLTSYKLWEHPLPELVIEMLSGGGSAKKDVGSKRDTYEHLRCASTGCSTRRATSSPRRWSATGFGPGATGRSRRTPPADCRAECCAWTCTSATANCASATR